MNYLKTNPHTLTGTWILHLKKYANLKNTSIKTIIESKYIFFFLKENSSTIASLIDK